MPSWIIAVQWLSRSVLVFLFILSIWSVATMIRCKRQLRDADRSPEEKDDEPARAAKWIEARQWDQLKEWAMRSTSLHAGTARAILQSPAADPSAVDRAVRSHLSLERSRLEQGLTILATLGSNAPFIGLFGTVLGVIQAFGALGVKQTNASDIMVGISEALVATAIGLFVAIPAVVAYNLFSRRLKDVIVRSEALKDLYLSRVRGN